MNCLIDCKEGAAGWVRELFPGAAPYMLRILNKPLLEYYIDFCWLLGIEEVRIVLYDSEIKTEKHFGDGAKWGVRISYGLAHDEDTMEGILAKNKGFCGANDMLIVTGPIFIDYDKKKIDYEFFKDPKAARCIRCCTGAVFYASAEEMARGVGWDEVAGVENAGFGLLELSNVRQYFDLSLDILKNKSGNFVVPGCGNEPGIFMGQNVEISRTAKITGPVMIGSKVQLKQAAVVGPNAIIGDNVIVDRFTSVENSVICGNSYVGCDLEIKDKIVHGRFLIDPNSGQRTELADKFPACQIDQKTISRIGRRVVESFVALLMFMIQGVPYLLFYPLMARKLRRSEKNGNRYFLNKQGDTRALRLLGRHPQGVLENIFFKLSLDKFPLLIEVLKGRLRLVGAPPIPVATGRPFLTELPFYHPAVFSYSEMLGDDAAADQGRIDELCYCHNASLALDMKIMFTTVANRLFM